MAASGNEFKQTDDTEEKLTPNQLQDNRLSVLQQAAKLQNELIINLIIDYASDIIPGITSRLFHLHGMQDKKTEVAFKLLKNLTGMNDQQARAFVTTCKPIAKRVGIGFNPHGEKVNKVKQQHYEQLEKLVQQQCASVDCLLDVIKLIHCFNVTRMENRKIEGFVDHRDKSIKDEHPGGRLGKALERTKTQVDIDKLEETLKQDSANVFKALAEQLEAKKLLSNEADQRLLSDANDVMYGLINKQTNDRNAEESKLTTQQKDQRRKTIAADPTQYTPSYASLPSKDTLVLRMARRSLISEFIRQLIHEVQPKLMDAVRYPDKPASHQLNAFNPFAQVLEIATLQVDLNAACDETIPGMFFQKVMDALTDRKKIVEELDRKVKLNIAMCSDPSNRNVQLMAQQGYAHAWYKHLVGGLIETVKIDDVMGKGAGEFGKLVQQLRMVEGYLQTQPTAGEDPVVREAANRAKLICVSDPVKPAAVKDQHVDHDRRSTI